ncbi:MAG: FKBP-type peptidyl-prolyl cis-trans isomerase [Paludibacteraceae bacterium]|nr:FKBP-type peptidyl-prolyl cis-trans isomerase [Paludibacteraceae bacterium]
MKTNLFAVAVIIAATLFSCNNGHCSAKIENHVDSVNYMFGIVNGSGIRESVLGNDTDEKSINLFCEGFEKVWGVTEGAEFVNNAGLRTGASIAKEINSGFLFTDSTIPAKKEIILETFEKTMKGEPFCLEGDASMNYLQNLLSSSLMTGQPTNPDKGQIDTINMCVGYLNARQARSYVLGKDTTEKDIKNFMKGFRKGLDMKEKDEKMLTGMNIAAQFTMGLSKDSCLFGEKTLPIEWEAIGRGVIDGVRKSKEMLMTADQAKEYLQNLIDEIQEAKNAPVIAENKEFLRINAERAEVKVTESGLQYEVVKEGKGAKPVATSTVKVHYTGKLIDGTVFDSSVERGTPAEFELSRVIPGWTEGIQLMTVGSKYIFYIPYNLAYGEQGAPGRIPGYSTLIFEVELIDIVK